MSKEFNLPGSSFEEIQKILKGYSLATENANLETLSKLTGLNPTVISRNNKFLSDIGLISGGMKKTTTELGKKLGRALDHKQPEDIRRFWKESVQTNEKVSGLVTTIRIKGGMSEKEFTDHVLYVSGQKNNSGNRTGARCVVDVLLEAGLIQETDGKLTITAPPIDQDQKAVALELESATKSASSDIQGAQLPNIPYGIPSGSAMIPQIAINIQLHLPETENAEVYEKLFKALREQLISPKD